MQCSHFGTSGWHSRKRIFDGRQFFIADDIRRPEKMIEDELDEWTDNELYKETKIAKPSWG